MGCHQVKISEAKTAITVSNNISLIQMYRQNLLLNKKDLTLIVEGLYIPDLKEPTPLTEDLDLFLNTHYCETTTLFKECYSKTLQRLIVTSKQLDRERYKVYLLNRTVGRLKGNIEVIIDDFPEIKNINMK